MIFQQIERSIFPKNSKRRMLIKKILIKFHLRSPFVPGEYNIWVQQQKKTLAQKLEYANLPDDIKISVVVPVYNTPLSDLRELVYSVVGQSYQNWELILVNASTDKLVIKETNGFMQTDLRIKVVSIKNKGIAHNTNTGIKLATGQYIAFCDHDDVLEPDALSSVVHKIINEHAGIIYTDEDKISDDSGVYFDPFFKPNWSPDLFTHVNYINHLTVLSKDLVKKTGLFNSKLDGAQDYDFYLRAISNKPIISHVPRVMYHWRASRGSTAHNFSSKRNILDSGKKALTEYFKRDNIDVTVDPKDRAPGFYYINFKKKLPVSVIILPIYSSVVDKIFVTKFINRTKLDNIKSEIIVSVIPKSNNNNNNLVEIKRYTSIYDYLVDALGRAKNETVIIVNKFLLPTDSEWADKLSGYINLEHVKAVAPLVMRSGNIIDSGGMIVDSHGNYSHLLRGRVVGHITNTIYGDLDWIRDVDAFGEGIVCARKKDIVKFLDSYSANDADIIFEFTKSNKGLNVMNTRSIFCNYGVYSDIKPGCDTFMNGNLQTENGDFYLKTRESGLINMLREMN